MSHPAEPASPRNVAAAPSAASSVATGNAPRGGLAAFLGLGILGGILGGFLLDSTSKTFPFIEPPEVARTQGIFSPEQRALVDKAQLTADRKNVPLAAGLLGLAVAGALGLAAGLAAGNGGKSAVLGLAIGAVAGALLGAGGGLAAIMSREALRGWHTLDEAGAPDPIKTQLHAMALHLPTWVGVAIAAGLAVTLTRRKGAGPFAAALVAVVLASVLFPTLAALISHSDATAVIPPGLHVCLMWGALNGLLLGVIMGHTPAQNAPSAG